MARKIPQITRKPSIKTEEMAVPSGKQVSRKGFIRTILASVGLTLGYGTLGIMILRYLWPYKKVIKQRIFVSTIDKIPSGHTITFSTPNGESYLLSNREVDGQTIYMAYSNRCPHLGCKVIWENETNRYFCPCHGGVFDTSGVAVEGPPAKAKQRLKKCEIEIVDKSIYAVTGSSV